MYLHIQQRTSGRKRDEVTSGSAPAGSPERKHARTHARTHSDKRAGDEGEIGGAPPSQQGYASLVRPPRWWWVRSPWRSCYTWASGRSASRLPTALRRAPAEASSSRPMSASRQLSVSLTPRPSNLSLLQPLSAGCSGDGLLFTTNHNPNRQSLSANREGLWNKGMRRVQLQGRAWAKGRGKALWKYQPIE